MKPGSGRRKGHDWEREVARLLRSIFPGARRGLQYRDGAECPDVTGTPFFVECKRGSPAKWPSRALEQADEDAPEHMPPVAVCKEDGREPTVTMYLGDWLDLVREWDERGRM